MTTKYSRKWPECDTTTRWFAGFGTMEKPLPDSSMALIPCEMRKEKSVCLLN